jgi:predicted amidophosphoribosyltransferase
MIDENFPTCTVCGREIASDADIPKRMTKYCKLCGMPTDGMGKFCCYKCEGKFKRFIKGFKERKVKK